MLLTTLTKTHISRQCHATGRWVVAILMQSIEAERFEYTCIVIGFGKNQSHPTWLGGLVESEQPKNMKDHAFSDRTQLNPMACLQSCSTINSYSSMIELPLNLTEISLFVLMRNSSRQFFTIVSLTDPPIWTRQLEKRQFNSSAWLHDI